MTSLRDLRETLDDHAAAIDDADRWARPVAVRERIRVVRRRRAAAGAVAAVLVVATGATVVASLDRPERPQAAAPPTVVGVDVPQRVAVHGVPYELTGGDPIEGEDDRLRLRGSEEERAVAFAASGLGSGSATLLVDGTAVARVVGGEGLEQPVPVGDAGATLRVRLDGAPDGAETGVAIYESAGLAPGVDNGEVVFRDTVAGGPLLAAAFAEDESAVAVTFRGRLPEVRLASYCAAAERGLWLQFEIDDLGPRGHSCQARDSASVGIVGGVLEDGARVRDHTVRAYLTRGARGPVVDSPGTDLGVAVYQQPAEPVEVFGTRVESQIEYAGRTWRLDRTPESFGDVDDWGTRVEASDTDLLIGLVAEGAMVQATWEGRLDRGGSASLGSPEGVAWMTAGVLLRGDDYDVRITGNGPVTRGALLIYRPL
ncbi:hypothetical protein [Nocardioides dongkuii]|uniref:hypothetical protein n=1 Tax=Nocardioides dongkuii TaxID=2760089 RepID=UPI0018779DB6|nr:hypothetical protein [Nocardioides dongkuii]